VFGQSEVFIGILAEKAIVGHVETWCVEGGIGLGSGEETVSKDGGRRPIEGRQLMLLCSLDLSSATCISKSAADSLSSGT